MLRVDVEGSSMLGLRGRRALMRAADSMRIHAAQERKRADRLQQVVRGSQAEYANRQREMRSLVWEAADAEFDARLNLALAPRAAGLLVAAEGRWNFMLGRLSMGLRAWALVEPDAKNVTDVALHKAVAREGVVRG